MSNGEREWRDGRSRLVYTWLDGADMAIEHLIGGQFRLLALYSMGGETLGVYPTLDAAKVAYLLLMGVHSE